MVQVLVGGEAGGCWEHCGEGICHGVQVMREGTMSTFPRTAIPSRSHYDERSAVQWRVNDGDPVDFDVRPGGKGLKAYSARVTR